MWAEGSGELGGNHLDEPCSWQERMKLEGWARVVYFLLWWNTHNTWCFTGCSDGWVRLQCAKPGFDPWVGKIPWRRKYYPLQYPCPENPMDGGAWQATVHGVAKSRTQRSDFISHIALNHLNYLQMYSSVISSTFTLLCNQSLEFFRLANLKLRINPLRSDSPIPPPSSPWQPLLYFLSEPDPRGLIWVNFYSVCLVVTGLFHLASCPRFIHLQHVSGFPSLLRLNNIPLYVYTTFCLPIHLFLDILICFPPFGFCDECCYKQFFEA